MPPTENQSFYPWTTVPDQSYGFVRGMALASQGTWNDGAVCDFGSSGAKDIQVTPMNLSTVEATATTTTNYGWQIQEADMDSTATDKRIVLSGDWALTGQTFSSVAALNSVTLRARLYRVAASPSFARTQIGPDQSVSLGLPTSIALAWNMTWTGMPEIVLEANETLFVSFWMSGTGQALGLTVTFRVGTNAGIPCRINVPSPGVRTLRVRSPVAESLPAASLLDRVAFFPRSLPAEDATTDASLNRGQVLGRGLPEAVPTVSALDRVYRVPRGLTESVSVGDVPTRSFVGGRPAPESIPTTDTLAASFKGERTMTESVPTTDPAPARKFTGGRGPSAESIPTTHPVPDRVYRAQRPLAETTLTVDTSLSRGYKGGRNNTEAIPTVDVIGRSIKQRRFLDEYPTGVNPDYAVTFPTRKIAGIVRDQNGDPYEGATVKLFRGQDDKMVQEATSAADGSYQFLRDMFDPYTYYVEAYEETDEPTAGVTERGLVPENV